MNYVPSAILLLFLVVVQQSSSQPDKPNKAIDDTCRNVSLPDFCISALRWDPHSASAKRSSQLGVILVDQINSKAKSTHPKISTLISQAKDTKLKHALSFCHGSYSTIVKGSVPASRGALIMGDPKFAEEYMTDVVQEMTGCDKEFEGLENPLRRENDFERKAASSIVAVITRTME